MAVIASERPAGLSVSEARLYDHLREHIEGEHLLLVEYEKFANEAGSDHLRYLTRLIMEDEVRHHERFTELLNTLRATAERVPLSDQVPPLVPAADAKALGKQVTRLAEFEREDARKLEAIQKELRDVRDTTVWSLLVELMQLDTEKHIRILHFIKDHATV